MRRLFAAWTLTLLAACGTAPQREVDTAALLLGEQHDAPEHPRLQREWVESLAARGRLAALALEMAVQGTSTAGLPRGADESTVQQALRWNTGAWPWVRYREPVMAAVRAGVPVLGANLPRAQMRDAMANERLDALLSAHALQAQRVAIRAGHCDLLSAAQIPPMTRVQIARDRAMAQTLAAAAVPGKTVVLVAGAGHVDPALGVPRHLPAAVTHRAVQLPEAPRDTDPCDGLRRQLAPARAASAPATP
jgi:uncharacterized iron-regulated protein